MLLNSDQMSVYGGASGSTTGGIISGYNAQMAEGDESTRRPKPVFFWSNGEVMKWLKRHCEEYYDLYGNVFLDNEVTGRSLIRINEHTLERMGIADPAHRDAIVRFILKLKLRSDIIEIKDLERKNAQQEAEQREKAAKKAAAKNAKTAAAAGTTNLSVDPALAPAPIPPQAATSKLSIPKATPSGSSFTKGMRHHIG